VNIQLPHFPEINITASLPHQSHEHTDSGTTAWCGDYANDTVDNLYHLALLLHHLIPAVKRDVRRFAQEKVHGIVF